MRCARTLAAPTAGSRVGWGGCCCCRRRWRAWPTSHISVRRLDTEWLVSPGQGVAVSTTKPASALTRDDLAESAPPEAGTCRRHRARLDTCLGRAWSGRRCYDDGPGRPGGHRRQGEPSGRQAGGEAFCWLAAWLAVNQSRPRRVPGIEYYDL
jgi:hypothetical protein